MDINLEVIILMRPLWGSERYNEKIVEEKGQISHRLLKWLLGVQKNRLKGMQQGESQFIVNTRYFELPLTKRNRINRRTEV